MNERMERQMDRIMDNNEEVESRCVPGCGYFGTWEMRGKEIEKLETEVERLRESARWRRWPEESPAETGYYTIYLDHMKYPVTSWFSVNSGWDVNHKLFWWIKLKMPKTETGGV